MSAATTADSQDAEAFRAALKSADFQSVRGSFRFGSNNHPTQDIYVREVVKEGGILTNRIIGVSLENHRDIYTKNCRM